jgi:hypothetical protein
VGKRLVVFLLPCWVLVMVLRRWVPAIRPSGLVCWMVLLYFLPFVLTNADPRFRLTLEGVVLLDLARMLYEFTGRRSLGFRQWWCEMGNLL